MELPSISKSAGYVSSLPMNFGDMVNIGVGAGVDLPLQRRIHDLGARPLTPIAQNIILSKAQKENQMTTARIVRVFIADPNENLALDRRVIYKSDEKLTDLTDQELFFDADPAGILRTHNEYRITVVDKKATNAQNKEVRLEPARIRDLKMVVVDIASF